jgi:hypothetical protein
MTQNEMIIKYLNEYGSITTYESYSKLFITRLSARIFDIKHKYGIEFDEEWVTKKNIYGKPCSFKKYILKGKEEEDV